MLLLAKRLESINISASNSLKEGKEELLTLHRLGMKDLFGRSFSTTNCIENLNSQLSKYLRKVNFLEKFGTTSSVGGSGLNGNRTQHAQGGQLQKIE